ncbi:glutamine amidotransferase [Candidatus Daviesbacteria bacterium]|nr:glutamine amidotransferase [Candidatus Daviesbacteria bacterium]
MKLTIGYLYGDLMNIYGDTGNIIALKKRAEWRGIEVEIKNISIGDKLKKGEVDIFFFGGGQDQAQELVSADLLKSGKGKLIKQEVERGMPLLAICGGYQLLGDYYRPHKGPKLPGISMFPAYTLASFDRMIGNIVIQSSAISYQLSDRKQKKSDDRRLTTDDFLVGFENHSGKTYLKKGANPLGLVSKGWGNNGKDKTEGCIYKNAIGCYMHGSLLPKNPKLADWLLKKALETKYGKEILLEPLDDTLELQAHGVAVKKFG